MSLSTKAFNNSVERISKFLARALQSSGIWFEFVKNDSLNVTHNSNNSNIWNSKEGRGGKNHGQIDSSGLDVALFYRDNPLQRLTFKFYISAKDGKVHGAPNYNYPSEIKTKQEMLRYLKEKNIWFCIIKDNGLRTWSWIDKYSNYSSDDWNEMSRWGKRNDRIYLKNKMTQSLKNWSILGSDYKIFKQKLKVILDENK